jgi:hypothetical protein
MHWAGFSREIELTRWMDRKIDERDRDREIICNQISGQLWPRQVDTEN